MKSKEEIERLGKQSAQKKYRLQHIPLEQIDEYGGEIASHVSIFSDAYTQCQEDVADKKYTEEDIVKALFKGFDYCLDNMTDDSSEITQDNVQDFINSLNKQD